MSCLANLNRAANSAGTSTPSQSLNPTARRALVDRSLVAGSVHESDDVLGQSRGELLRPRWQSRQDDLGCAGVDQSLDLFSRRRLGPPGRLRPGFGPVGRSRAGHGRWPCSAHRGSGSFGGTRRYPRASGSSRCPRARRRDAASASRRRPRSGSAGERPALVRRSRRQPIVHALEIKRRRLGPQAPGDRERLTQGIDRLPDRHDIDSVCAVLPLGDRGDDGSAVRA